MILAEAGQSTNLHCGPVALLTSRRFPLGKDATEAFEDVGHSDEAREILEKLYIGDFEGSVVCPLSTLSDQLWAQKN